MQARILLVDDDAATLRTMESILRRNGFARAAVPNPAEALRLARSERFDLLVAALMMRPIPGDDLVMALRRGGVLLPAVILAGRSAETWSRLMRIPRVMAVSKPFTPDEFARGIRTALDRWWRTRVA